MSTIIPLQPLASHGCQYTTTGLVMTGDLQYETWAQMGVVLLAVADSLQWAIGDWINYGAVKYGGKYAEAVEITHLPQSTLEQYAWVANQFEISRRRENLSWTHHAEVAPLTPDQQDQLLDLAEDNNLSTRALRMEVQRGKKTATALALPQETFNVIYADPPWQYDNTGVHGAADHHYGTMELQDICRLGQRLTIADDAALFLWVTNPFLRDAFEVVEAWGFEYKTNIVWVKTDLVKPGSGFYVRGRHELLFICTRGSFTPLDQHISPPIGSVVTAPVSEHSAKPDEFYTIIERLYPNCHYLELFARRTRKGWASYGNEL